MSDPVRYVVVLRPSARRDLDRFPRDVRRRMRDVLQQLADQPRGVQTKRLAGSSDYRRRVGDYRIVYEIDDKALLVTINAVRHRKDAYRG